LIFLLNKYSREGIPNIWIEANDAQIIVEKDNGLEMLEISVNGRDILFFLQ